MMGRDGFINYSARKWRPWHNKELDDLYTVQPGGCWLWTGTIHKHQGVPIYKGWGAAKTIVYNAHHERFGLPPLNGLRILGTSCGSKICVAPAHQKISSPVQTEKKQKQGPAKEVVAVMEKIRELEQGESAMFDGVHIKLVRNALQNLWNHDKSRVYRTLTDCETIYVIRTIK